MKNKVAIIIDESSSMGPVRQETIEMINEQFETLKKQDAEVSLYKFNTTVTKVFSDRDSKTLYPFKDYLPFGWTALYDSVGEVIDAMSNDNRNLIIIITDGMENSSKKYNKQQIMSKIQEANENWTFTFLGTTIEQLQEAQSWGIPIGNSAVFANNSQGLRSASVMVSRGINKVFDNYSVGNNSLKDFYK